MYHSPDTAFHLRKLFGLFRIFNQSALLDNVAILPMILLHMLIRSPQSCPRFFRHGRIKSLAKLETYFLRDTFLVEHFVKRFQVGGFVLDDLEGSIGAEAGRPSWIARVEVGS